MSGALSGWASIIAQLYHMIIRNVFMAAVIAVIVFDLILDIIERLKRVIK